MPEPKRDRGFFQRWAFAGWKETGLPDEDRHELATMIFKRDLSSWSQLTTAELGVMAWVLRGWHLIEVLRAQRGNVSRPYGGGVADRSVRDAEHHPDPEAHGRAAVSGSGRVRGGG